MTVTLTARAEESLQALAARRGQAPETVIETALDALLLHGDLQQEGEPHPTAGTEPARRPNEAGLAVLRRVAEIKQGMPESDGSQTDRLLRESRAGAMYGDPSPQ